MTTHLPQLSSCGPIEATSASRSGARPRPFRNCQVAAPLKRALQLFLLRLAAPPFRNCQVAAPLKRHRRAHLQSGRAAFRNCQVAAPLKQRADLLDQRPDLPFRNCQVAAPLKRLRAGNDIRHGPPPFRNCQVAAPLKQAPATLRSLQISCLPQLSSCGPIEAATTAPSASPSASPSATVKLRPH